MLVIDSLMGRGKTTYAINHINKNKHQQFLFITPFISECQRVSEATGIMTPVDDNELGTKRDQAIEAIEFGRSLVITHSLFLLIPKQQVQSLSSYQIIIDEALATCEHLPMSSGEITSMLRDEVVTVKDEHEHYKRLELNTPDHLKNTPLLRFHHNRLSGNADLLLSDNNLVVMMLPACVFEDDSRITLLTYNYEGSDFQAYLKMRGIVPTIKSVLDGELVDYTAQDGSAFRNLINVVDHKKLNEQKANKNQRYTKKFYYRLTGEGLKEIRNNLRNYYSNIVKTPSSKNLWTVFECSDFVEHFTDSEGAAWFTGGGNKKNIRDLLMTKPYRQVGSKKFEYDFSHMIGEDGMDLTSERKRQCWIPINCKGTNMYADRTSLAYMVNLNLSPAIINFFRLVNGVAPCNDTFALNMLVQWIFRSAVRNGEPINLYIPSKRMRHLLLTWLGYGEKELF